jgi:hypothetical protein
MPYYTSFPFTTPSNQGNQDFQIDIQGRKIAAFAAPSTLGPKDVNAAALTQTSTVSGVILTDSASANVYHIAVTSYTGLTSFDLVLQETYDNGSIFIDVFHIERITGNTTIQTPPIASTGRRQWKYTFGGTGSLTLNISTSAISSVPKLVRKFYDRTANLLNGTSTTAGTIFQVGGTKNIRGVINLGTTTTPAVYQLRLSDDASNWTVYSTVTGVAAGSVAVNITNNASQYAQWYCVTSGSSQTGNYLQLLASE